MNGKADVRKKMRGRPRLDPKERRDRSARLCEAIGRETAWERAGTVALFAPQDTEPDVELLWLQAGAKIFCYPRLSTGGLDFVRVLDRATLTMGRWNIREPAFGSAQIVAPSEIDLILVPGVAFTREGERLGRGGGYYDRFLAQREVRAVKIGICFVEQLVDELPIDPHDARVDCVIAA
jgi:5-formyltetrahydrofolate cyclo-ligase